MAPSEQHDDERATPDGQQPDVGGGADAPAPPGGPLRQDAPSGGTAPGGPGTPAQPGTPHRVDDPATSTRPDEPTSVPHVEPDEQPPPRHRREDPSVLDGEESAQEQNAETSEGEPSDASGNE